MDSLEDAIYYAAQRVHEKDGNKTEYVSAIYQLLNGSYGFTEPAGGKQEGSFKEGIRLPRGAKLVSYVHNHPESSDHRTDESLFPPGDTEQIEALKTLGAIVYGEDMSIATYQPGRDPVKRGISKGRAFDHIPEIRSLAQQGRRLQR